MKHESRTERLSGPLALCCAIAVFLAAEFDVTGAEAAPAVAGVVRVAPWLGAEVDPGPRRRVGGGLRRLQFSANLGRPNAVLGKYRPRYPKRSLSRRGVDPRNSPV